MTKKSVFRKTFDEYEIAVELFTITKVIALLFVPADPLGRFSSASFEQAFV